MLCEKKKRNPVPLKRSLGPLTVCQALSAPPGPAVPAQSQWDIQHPISALLASSKHRPPHHLVVVNPCPIEAAAGLGNSPSPPSHGFCPRGFTHEPMSCPCLGQAQPCPWRCVWSQGWSCPGLAGAAGEDGLPGPALSSTVAPRETPALWNYGCWSWKVQWSNVLQAWGAAIYLYLCMLTDTPDSLCSSPSWSCCSQHHRLPSKVVESPSLKVFK